MQREGDLASTPRGCALGKVLGLAGGRGPGWHLLGYLGPKVGSLTTVILSRSLSFVMFLPLGCCFSFKDLRKVPFQRFQPSSVELERALGLRIRGHLL